MKDFRFGVHVFAPSGPHEWVRLARQAEDSGFSVLTVPDHLVDGCISPIAALAVAAETTSKLRIGTLVLNNDLRHPSLVARDALALDSLSGGRIELGLGGGSAMSAPEYEAVGLHFDDAATRVARLGESVEVLDVLLRGGHVTFTGDHYRLSTRAWPPPTQLPRPPILVGGTGRRLLRMAAVRADIVSVSGIGSNDFRPDTVDERVALVRAASAGRTIELQALVQRVAVTDDPRRLVEQVRASLPDLSVEDILATPYLWIGTVQSICEQILAARERWGFSYFTVFNDSLDTIAPVVARLVHA